MSTPTSDSNDEPREWLIRKRGYYYRPERAGYTASVDEAGRYTETEAKAEAAIEPKIMSAVHQSTVGGASPVVLASKYCYVVAYLEECHTVAMVSVSGSKHRAAGWYLQIADGVQATRFFGPFDTPQAAFAAVPNTTETLPCALPPPVALSETDVAIAQTAATARAEMCGICDEEFIGHRHGARGHDWMPKSPPPAQKAEVCGRCRGSGRVPSPGGVEGEYCACGRCGGSGHAKSEGDQR